MASRPATNGRVLPSSQTGSSIPANTSNPRAPTKDTRPKRFGEFVDGRLSKLQNVRRWDGAARTSYLWDNLRRDPELWDNHGNCYVHLHGQGQSRRGPAFKLPFSVLVEQRCTPLLERFMAGEEGSSTSSSHAESSEAAAARGRHQQHQPHRPRASMVIPENRAATGVAEERIELYIPAPPGSDKEQALAYHLATRNFFAWLLRRSLVGESLGAAQAGLLNSMHEFRDPDLDHLQDLYAYLDEEGYLDFVGQPNNAIAILHFAESFQLRDLYVEAFAHCVGMCESLYRSSEFQYISAKSRKQIRKARADMDTRLSTAGSRLKTFLKDDLSESHLGLTTEMRAHMNRFRSFVRDFYADQFPGCYSPTSSNPTLSPRPASDEGQGSHIDNIYRPAFYRTLRDDFEALYEYLVDERFTAGDSTPPTLAQGGLCVEQSVDAFDRRHGYASLAHPLPLLPEIAPKHKGSSPLGPASPSNSTISLLHPRSRPATSSSNKSSPTKSRRLSWLALARPDKNKLRADGRLVAHAALMRATNSSKVHLMENELVSAFRRFEEESVSGGSAGMGGSKVLEKKAASSASTSNLVDARKVRWILVYCVYQTVRGCVPTWVSCSRSEDGDDDAPLAVTYHTAIDSENFLTPWDNEHTMASLVRSQTTMVRDQSSRDGNSNDQFRPTTAPAHVTEIKPDVDYYALTHRGESERAGRSRTPVGTDSTVDVPPRKSSLTRNISRNAAFRRSIGIFRGSGSSTSSGGQATVPSSPVATNKALATAPATTARSNSGGKTPATARPKSMYQEIVVQGYGNGTNHVSFSHERRVSMDDGGNLYGGPEVEHEVIILSADAHDDAEASSAAASQRSPSTASNTSTGSAESSVSLAMSWATAATTAPNSPVDTASLSGFPASSKTMAEQLHQSQASTSTTAPGSPPPPAVPTRSPARNSRIFAEAEWPARMPSPLRIQKGAPLPPLDTMISEDVMDLIRPMAPFAIDQHSDDDDWRSVPAPRSAPARGGEDEALVHAWDQFPELGGLVPAASAAPVSHL